MLLLNDHLRTGGALPADLDQLPDGRWRDRADGWMGKAFQFDWVKPHAGEPGYWRGENRRTLAMRIAESIGRALAGEPALPWDTARREAYLQAWPVPQQMEALTEAADGRPEKLAQMRADFAAIRAAHPKPLP